MEDDKIRNLLAFTAEAKTLSFFDDSYYISEEEKLLLNKFSIPNEEYGHKYLLKLKSYFEYTRLKYSHILESDLMFSDVGTDFLVFDNSGTIVSFSATERKFCCHGLSNNSLLTRIKNLTAYYRLFNFLRGQNFCDYFNDANNEIIFYSSINGIFRLKYDTIPIVNFSDNIESSVESLIELAKSVEVAPFFKNAVYSLSLGTGTVTVTQIIEKSEVVVSVTQRDYELVAKKFDFSAFKDSLYLEKQKYFSDLREIINKIFNQAVAVPVSISAAVFATYKVADDWFILVIVLLAFMAYVAFYIKIQLLYRNEIDELGKSFKADFKNIKENSGLDSTLIESEAKKIISKIDSSISLIYYLVALVGFLGLLVVYYIVYMILKSEGLIIIKNILDIALLYFMTRYSYYL